MASSPLAWRLNAAADGFDELVVHGRAPGACLIHAEMMDARAIFVTVGDLAIWAHVARNGQVKITHTEWRSKEPVPELWVEPPAAQRQSLARKGDHGRF